jgi:hypothetical protein
MFDNLPAHLQTLNSVASPPSTALNRESEEAFWDFMHTDQLFDNFSAVSPEAVKAEPSRPAPPASTPEPAQAKGNADRPMIPAATLESFIAAFANEHAASTPNNQYRLPVPLPLPYNSAASSSPPTPAPIGVDTAAIMPPYDGDSPTDERISGAKRLKQLGAGPAEIEEEYVVFAPFASYL